MKHSARDSTPLEISLNFESQGKKVAPSPEQNAFVCREEGFVQLVSEQPGRRKGVGVDGFEAGVKAFELLFS